MAETWQEYFQHTRGNPPRPLLMQALGYVKEKNHALDLGAGALNDTVYLLSQGFKKVTALDRTPIAQEIISNLPSEKFEYVILPFDAFEFPESEYDLMNAQYALPFNSPHTFGVVFENVVRSLKPGGIFAGQLFGERDEWHINARMNFHSREQVEQLLSALETIEITEEELDSPTASGHMKHWHVFHILAKK